MVIKNFVSGRQKVVSLTLLVLALFALISKAFVVAAGTDEINKEVESIASEERVSLEKAEVKVLAEEPEIVNMANEQSEMEQSNVNSDWITVTSTAYTADCDGCSGITYTGKDVRSGDHKVIAVDPKVIPLGSLVVIQGLGVYEALDVGSAIKGHKIDILKPDKESAINHGVKSVKIKIIRKGF